MTSDGASESVRAEVRWVGGLRRLGILGAWLLLLLALATPTSWQGQSALAMAVVALTLAVNRWFRSSAASLFLVLISCVFTARYGLWRITTVAHLLRGPGARPSVLDSCVLLLLLFAELYSILNLGLGYFQMTCPLRRAPVSLPEDPKEWPEVDLFIPTLDEPMHVLKYTALGALNLDWPPDRLNVYVLDDGRREEVRAFCAEADIGYMTRDGNQDAKAGNLNSALARTSAPFIAIFDADHVPVRSFLQMTMGWFDRDARLGVLQTPQHLYSPDPFERNLNQFRAVPNEGELFYGVVQDGNDLWDATYFCGTGAVLRRAALDSVGGIATETVTEDAHTSLRMQKKGWNTAYINLPLTAGLATERLSEHIRQRRRWARGMVQVLRTENPLFARGLTLAQRLCYFHATAHFLNAVPRLIFLTAPIMYLVLGRTTIPGYWAAVLAYAVPHLALGYIANARLQGAHRFSFWNEIYETVLAPFLVLPTLIAFVLPKAGRFHTTVKGDVVERGFFDTRAAWPIAMLFCANLAGLGCAVLHLIPARVPGFWGRWAAHLYGRQDAGALWVNAAWTSFNLIILTVALGVASERRQRRRSVRLPKRAHAELVFSDGRWMEGETEDVSVGGLQVRCQEAVDVRLHEAVNVVLSVQGQETVLPATVVEATLRALRVRFDLLTLKEEEALAVMLYSPADAWIGWGPAQEADRPLRSFARIASLAARSVSSAVRTVLTPAASRLMAIAICLLSLGLSGLLLLPTGVRAQDASGRQVSARSAKQPVTERSFRLDDLTSPGNVTLQGAGSSQGMHFDVGSNEVIQRADLRLRYRLSGEFQSAGALQILLNGVVIASAPGANSGARDEDAARAGREGWSDLTFTLPPELLVHSNELVLRLSASGCFTSSCSTEAAQVETAASELHLVQQDIAAVPGASAGVAARGSPGSTGRLPRAFWRGRWRAVVAGLAPVGMQFVSAAVLSVWIAACCLALAYLLRGALRQRALLRLRL